MQIFGITFAVVSTIYFIMTFIWGIGYVIERDSRWCQSGKEYVDQQWKGYNKVYIIVSIVMLVFMIAFFILIANN
jgi:hypothetical protein